MHPAARRLRLPVVWLAAGALLLPGATAHAQGCSGGGNYNLRSTPAILSYGPVSTTDLDAGQIVAGSVVVSIVPRGRTNFDWQLCVRGEAPFFGPANKPIEAVEWQVAGGPWQPITVGEQLVTTGSRRTDVEVLFRVAVDYGDAAGDYEALLAFEVMRQ